MKKINKIMNGIKNSAPVLLVLLVLFAISSLITIYNGWEIGSDLYSEHFKHEEMLLDKISHLSADTNIVYFESLLGQPVFVNAYANTFNKENPSDYREYIFVDDLFYVQAVTDASSKVLIFSVTTRSKDFHPTLSLGPYSANEEQHFLVELGKTHFENAFDSSPEKVLSYMGANRFSYAEYYYFGNPGNYQTYILGYNQAGYLGSSVDKLVDVPWIFDEDLPETKPDEASTGKYDSRVIAFRRAATVNTYAVTSPFLDNFNGSGILKNFFPGPDYGQVRILDTN